METHFETVGALIMPLCGVVWAIFMLRFALAQRAAALQAHIDMLETFRKALAPALGPVPADVPEKKAPATWAEYQADLWRMVDGRISIDEFVDKWRGREKPRRPTPAELKLEAIRARIAERDRAAAAMTPVQGWYGASGPSAWMGATGYAGVTGMAWTGVTGPAWPPQAARPSVPGIPAFNVGEWVRVTCVHSMAFGDPARILDIRLDGSIGAIYRLELGLNEMADMTGSDIEHAHPKAGETWARTPCSRHGDGSAPWKFGVDAPDMAWMVRCGCLRPVNFGKTRTFEERMEEVRRATDAETAVFNTINTVIKEFSKGLEGIVSLKKLEALTPVAQDAAMHPQPRFRKDQWVRIGDEPPVAGRLARIVGIYPFGGMAPRYRAEYLPGQYITLCEDVLAPAVPRTNEWWRHADADVEFLCAEDYPDNSPDAEDVAAGKLFPVNFGRGSAAA